MNILFRFPLKPLTCALAFAVAACAWLVEPHLVLAQMRSVTAFDRLEMFVGTWTARNPNESAPYLTLKFTKKDGKLVGSVNRFKIRVVGRGRLVGIPGPPGEIPISDPSIGQTAVVEFGWDEDFSSPGSREQLRIEGTQVASLLFSVPREQMEKIMAENRATAFYPMISLRREPESAYPAKQPEHAVADWEVTLMVRVVNAAEADYKFSHGRYADYATLVHSGQLLDTDGHRFKILPGDLNSETDPLPGFDLRLGISPDGSTYQLSVQEESATGCGRAVFSDERGIILEGHVAGCATN